MDAYYPPWIYDMMMMLGSLRGGEVMTSSISRVSDKIRQAKEKAYVPEIVSIGPLSFHWKSRRVSNLEFMEGIKWRYTHALFAGRIEKGYLEAFRNCCEAVRKIDGPVRASYGVNIQMEPEQLAKIMVLDGCFILELLLRLYHHITGTPQPKYGIDLSLDDMDHKLGRVLRDLTLLENQIPFLVLTTLSRFLLQNKNERNNDDFLTDGWVYKFPSLQELVEEVFGYKVHPSNGGGGGLCLCHFLHLVYASSIDSCYVNTFKDATQELERCAKNLQVLGIQIQTPHTIAIPSTGHGADQTVASELREFKETFDFEIVYNPTARELIIPPLHINEGTEVKWRNLIAWEQCGTVGYKFTSYAYFFKGLICCVGDIQLLKARKVIIVHEKNKKIRDQELLTMFQTTTTGVQRMDGRYSDICCCLNKVEGHRLTEWCTMKWHQAPGYLAQFGQQTIKHIETYMQTFRKEYIPDPWKFIALLAAIIYLVLNMLQTYYASRS